MPKFFQHWQTIGIIGGLLAVLLFPFFQLKTVFFGDNYSLLVPGKIFTAYWLRQGFLPLWNPYSFGGISWIGDINQSVIYPSSVIFSLIHPAFALNLVIVAQLLISAVGMFWLTKDWWRLSKNDQLTPTTRKYAYLIAVVLWLFSQKLVGSLNNLSILQSLSWMPWVVWASLELAARQKINWRKLIILAGLVALQLAGGYPQHVLYAVGVAGLLSGWLVWHQQRSWRLWFSQWFLAGGIAACLSAVIWLPFIAVIASSTRVVQSIAQSTEGSLHPAELVKFLVPYIFEQPTKGVVWGPNWNRTPSEIVYLGWLGLFTLGWSWWTKALAKKDVFLLMVSAGAIIGALGGFLPGFELLQSALPLLKIVRNPSSLLVIPSLLLPLVLAPQMVRLNFSPELWRKIFLVATSLAVTCLGLWWLQQFYFSSFWQSVDQLLAGRISQSFFHTLEKDQLIAEMVTQSLVVSSLVLLASLIALRSKKLTVVVILLGLDLIYHSRGSLFFAPFTIYPSWAEISQRQIEIPIGPTHNGRYLIRNGNQPYTDFPTYWNALARRQPFTDSFIDQEELNEFMILQNMSRGLTPNWHQVYRVPAITGYTTLIPQDVNQTWNQTGEVAINSLPSIAVDDPNLQKWAVKRYLVDTWFAVGEDLTRLPLLTVRDQWQTYQLLGDDRIRLLTGQRIGLVEVEETPNQLWLRLLPTTNAGTVVVANRYDSAWQVLVNGQPTSINNYQGMISFNIPAQTEQITLIYQPNMFYVGLLISLVSSISLVGWWFGVGWLQMLSTHKR